MHVQDGSRTWVAVDLEDLSTQLRGQYPDGTFERTLRSERDLEAEETAGGMGVTAILERVSRGVRAIEAPSIARNCTLNCGPP